MSPILKRDVAEHVRQARRLSSVLFHAPESDLPDPSDDPRGSPSASGSTKLDSEAYVSAYRDPRQDAGHTNGIGVASGTLGVEKQDGAGWWKGTKAEMEEGSTRDRRRSIPTAEHGRTEGTDENEELYREDEETMDRPEGSRRLSLQYAEPESASTSTTKDQLHDLRNILLEVRFYQSPVEQR